MPRSYYLKRPKVGDVIVTSRFGPVRVVKVHGYGQKLDVIGFGHREETIERVESGYWRRQINHFDLPSTIVTFGPEHRPYWVCRDLMSIYAGELLEATSYDLAEDMFCGYVRNSNTGRLDVSSFHRSELIEADGTDRPARIPAPA